ncbi:hypothetical protein [Hyphomicrobium sp. CS1GBMeth3]|uniref:hypothetical protein n=1 Tax=Hyphomicrobium sp. CS1GBMeth3 TaxID=1892845 RepID=UPI0009302418|nr:hypothetical protein [Hyphomicrobium sp. CS1GBMeth3]
MRILAVMLLAFVLGATTGWILAMGLYTIQTGWLGVHDHDGGGAMAYGLIIGPLAGLFLGTVLAAYAGLRLARTKPDAGRQP